ncbi:MAG: hypothetical protein P794_00180 [Epsilonproteobacteria bacterium (ex Lamellibrachia satsuma)]|nr:MAG: hypothetical protein P794_00180 [Epsilonproteobacteria bacterium (ex Lamellibrachia satsuma)]
MPSNLQNRINKLEAIENTKVSGIIIYFKNAKQKMITNDDADAERIVEADCYLDQCGSEKMSLDRAKEYTKFNSYKYVCCLPTKEKTYAEVI